MRGTLKSIDGNGADRSLSDSWSLLQTWLTPSGLRADRRARWKPSLVLIYVWLIAVSMIIAATLDGPPQILSGHVDITARDITTAQDTRWSDEVTARHMAAAKNCDAARAVGLAPSRRGEPGYWPWLDRDNDGIACEPWRGR